MKAEYKRYPPDGFYNERGIGIALPLNRISRGRKYSTDYSSGSYVHSGLFSTTYTTEDQAIHNLVNLLLTRKGERVMQPNFGSRVPDFVFEQNSELNRFELAVDIRNDIEFWLPYIIVGEVKVSAGGANVSGDPMHAVTISIPFKVTESGANKNITLRVSELGYDYSVEQ